MLKKDLFLESYNKLNKEQKLAVDEIDGPVMVIAGPGTGKTRILTLRIANILRKTDTDARNILALTFTEAGVASIKNKLAEIIGESAYRVGIYTFHGFCNDIIGQYPDEFPHIIGSKNITDVEQIKIIENILDSNSFKMLKPSGDPFHYLKSIISSINNLKREGIGTNKFSKISLSKKRDFYEIPDLYHTKGKYSGVMKMKYKNILKNILKNIELSKIYKKYEETLKKKKLYDYNDMIMNVSDALSKNKDLLLTLQERYLYFLVDEHQDTNNAQNKVLELLASFYPNPNLFIVGDDKQAIFRFQGASLLNFLYFKKLFPKTKQIILKNNYRSNQHILDSAHSIAKKIKTAENPKLRGQKKNKKKIKLYAFLSKDIELFWIAADIKKKIELKAKPEEMAVLYRDNSDAFPVIEAFQKLKIPYSLESNQNILEDSEIQKLILIFNAIENFGRHREFIEAMHIDFLNIHPLDIYKIANYADKNRKTKSIFDVIESNSILNSLNVKSLKNIQNFYENIILWKKIDKNDGLVRVFESVVQTSGFLENILKSDDPLSRIEKTNAFFDEVKIIMENNKKAKIEDLFLYLDTLREHKISINKNISTISEGRVRLMTAHRSKGREFEYVYIIHANEGHWGNRKRYNMLSLIPLENNVEKMDLDDLKIDDERRLFYVAMTRAKRDVSISYFLKNNEGKNKLPSQFIYEIDKKFLEEMDVGKFEEEYKKFPFFMMKTDKKNLKDEKQFIREIFLKNNFSVTHLNNYLKCPWEYFYVNLLRIPQAETNSQLYGTSVHSALKDFFDAIERANKAENKKKKIGKTFLINQFEIHLKNKYLKEADYKEFFEKGKNALGGWYDKYHLFFSKNKIITEKNIQGIVIKSKGKINLSGKIDKMEIVGDDNKVIITDYKTSKPKSRGEIEGKTKSPMSGDIMRQLVFYKLLLDKYENGRYKMISGIVDFIEPNNNGNYKQEKFEITKEQVGELKDLIRKVSDEILSFSFVNKTCNKENCKYCKLRKIMF